MGACTCLALPPYSCNSFNISSGTAPCTTTQFKSCTLLETDTATFSSAKERILAWQLSKQEQVRILQSLGGWPFVQRCAIRFEMGEKEGMCSVVMRDIDHFPITIASIQSAKQLMHYSPVACPCPYFSAAVSTKECRLINQMDLFVSLW